MHSTRMNKYDKNKVQFTKRKEQEGHEQSQYYDDQNHNVFCKPISIKTPKSHHFLLHINSFYKFIATI